MQKRGLRTTVFGAGFRCPNVWPQPQGADGAVLEVLELALSWGQAPGTSKGKPR
jgi:hypothetical protein